MTAAKSAGRATARVAGPCPGDAEQGQVPPLRKAKADARTIDILDSLPARLSGAAPAQGSRLPALPVTPGGEQAENVQDETEGDQWEIADPVVDGEALAGVGRS